MNLSSRKGSIAAGFGLAWLILNAAGWGLGFGLQFMLMKGGDLENILSLAGVLVAAGVIGLTQWLALRWLLPVLAPGSMGISWVILTMFGYSVGFLGASVLVNSLADVSDPAAVAAITFISWALVGLATGLLQWAELRLAARGGRWWIFSSALGYGLGALLLGILRLQQGSSPYAYAMAGLVVGMATLVSVSRLRRTARPVPGTAAE
jgi:hypothetical protein